MRVTPTQLQEVLLIEPRVFEDERGWFLEDFQDTRFEEHGLPSHFRQENQSRSKHAVLRGLHYQMTRPQGKLISCIHGEVFDVAVDIRRGSPTFGRWVGIHLSGDKPQQLWIPPGFAHGYCVLSPSAHVAYKCSDIYVPSDERGLLWSDPDIGITWPLEHPIVSARDRSNRALRDCMHELPDYAEFLQRR